MEVARLLKKYGAEVKTYDPYKPANNLVDLDFSNDFEEAAGAADVLVLLVGHQELRKMTPADLAKLTKARILVDAVHAWADEAWEKAGFSVFELGVRKKLSLFSKVGVLCCEFSRSLEHGLRPLKWRLWLRRWKLQKKLNP